MKLDQYLSAALHPYMLILIVVTGLLWSIIPNPYALFGSFITGALLGANAERIVKKLETWL